MPSLDLDAYLARIGYAGPRTPTADTLRALHVAHPEAIAFESLAPWSGQTVDLDITALVTKLVHHKRGGYCYEHNTLFWAALDALGFKVRGLSARVVYSTPPGGGRHPRNHMLMLVATPHGDHVADVGFGGLTLTAPIRLEAETIQATPHERVRLTRASGDWVLEAETLDADGRSTWRQMYQFGLEEHIASDYEMANYYMSTHPRSPFVARLIAARPLPGKRLALANTSLSVHTAGGGTEKRDVTSSAELRRILVEDFSIAIPADAATTARLDRLFA